MQLKIAFLLLFGIIEVSAVWRPRCKDEYRVAWWPIPPYMYQENDTVSGVFPEVMLKMVRECCQAPINLTYDIMLANKIEAVEQVSNGTADFVLPLIVKTGKKKFLSFPLVPIIDSPGIAFYSAAPLSAGETLVKIIVESAPVLIVMAIIVLIAGTMYWILELRGQSPIISGFLNGLWWAFISMTTVGYGDLALKTKAGQVAAIFWILVGLVGCSLFVAVVSSVLTMACLSQKMELSGNQIAVLEGSQEHLMAIKGSALPLALGNVEQIAESLQHGHAIGALLDSYVAGSYQDLFKNFRLNDLKEDLFSYGVVLMPTVMKYERCFRDYLTSRQDFIFHAISKNIVPLKTTTNQSRAEEMANNILHFEALPIHIVILIMFFAVAFIFATCFLKEHFIVKRQAASRKNSVHSKREDKRNLIDEEHLQKLKQLHRKEVTEYLQRMHKDAGMLQGICHKAFLRAETESKLKGYENGIIIETSC
eukprot:Seg3483.1 transcript_id=Seg3483.1/GoldUCD/mRNA.D3Y31 product="Hyperpolarization-activated voltage-gated potassium channel" protein_id=Seg3483.1/GoldUCD/D3Y31